MAFLLQHSVVTGDTPCNPTCERRKFSSSDHISAEHTIESMSVAKSS